MNNVTSISISGRILLNLHSLNNEGSEGNQTLTRQVTIIDKDGKAVTVTAVSGDMMKHILCEHFWRISKEEGLKLSKTSRVFNANRIVSKDLGVSKEDLKSQSVASDKVIEICSLSDIAGAMITDIGNFSRKSIAEFGWLVAIPNANETENYFHAKFVPDSSSTETDDSNVGQNIFHRPANSGIYAFVGNFEIARLGYNDIKKEYSINDEERKKRYKALQKAIIYSFVKPSGAMRNTQNPHIVDFNGMITYSTSSCPSPAISAINDDYKEEIRRTTEHLNKIVDNSLYTIEFSSVSEFAEKMHQLYSSTAPGKIDNDHD